MINNIRRVLTCDGFEEAIKACNEKPSYDNLVELYKWVILMKKFMHKCKFSPDSIGNRINGVNTLEQMCAMVRKAHPIANGESKICAKIIL